MDLRWSFNHSADHLWERLDADLWELTHNPWVVLQTVSRDRLQSVTADPNFQTLLTDLHREKKVAEESEGWFQEAHSHSGLTAIAYFSMEFMLSEALPIYSGGLGNVAGDQLKAASHLGAGNARCLVEPSVGRPYRGQPQLLATNSPVTR